MGTRAIICINGDPFVTVHWNGEPENLGKKLANTTREEEILSIAESCVITTACKRILQQVSDKRVSYLAEKHDLSESEIKDGLRRAFVLEPEDYPIGSIDRYGDTPDYQYNLVEDKWYYRELDDKYPECMKCSKEFILLTKKRTALQNQDKKIKGRK